MNDTFIASATVTFLIFSATVIVEMQGAVSSTAVAVLLKVTLGSNRWSHQMDGPGKLEQESIIDLSNCDREPIHSPGSIQSHGYLIVVSSALKILQVSRNLETRLGLPLADIVNQPINKFLEESMMAVLDAYLRFENVKTLVPIPLEFKAVEREPLLVTCVAHRYDGYIILELDPLDARTPGFGLEPTVSLSQLLYQALMELHEGKDLRQTLNIASKVIKKMTGYDRVLVYSFDQDWHGEVVAEAKNSKLEPLLGLHYPASDIPVQARELYLRNLVRLLVNVDSTSIDIAPANNPVTNQALDMTDCVLRSCSPIHIEYLKNMKVGATLTVSIVLKGKLWGLIACHHYAPFYQPHWIRSACQLFAQNLSLKIMSLLDAEDLEFKIDCADHFAELVTLMRDDNIPLHQFKRVAANFLRLFKASGMCLIKEAEVTTFGAVPERTALLHCARMLSEGVNSFVALDCSENFAELDFPADIAGFLAFQIGWIKSEWMILFRAPRVASVHWAGNPKKVVESSENGLRFHPRHSFELFIEEVKDKSAPWKLSETNAAKDLQTKLLEMGRRNLERDLAQVRTMETERNEFIANIAHDLKNPIAGALCVFELMKEGELGNSLDGFIHVLDQLIESHNMLLSRIKSLLLVYQFAEGTAQVCLEKVEIYELLEKVVAIAVVGSQQTIVFEKPQGLCFVNAEPDSLSRVFENLVSNASKYSPKSSSITVSIKPNHQEIDIVVSNRGLGVNAEELPHLFQRYWRGKEAKRYAVGSGLGLYTCKRIVEAHGGHIACTSKPTEETRFVVTLPLLGNPTAA